MNGKNARLLRQRIGMKKENLRQGDYAVLKKVKKIVHLRNKLGELALPREVEREVVVNKNKYFYRKVKKQFYKENKKRG